MSSDLQLAFQARTPSVLGHAHSSSMTRIAAETQSADGLVGPFHAFCSAVSLSIARRARMFMRVRPGPHVRPVSNLTAFAITPDPGEERLLLTLVFTDIVASTELLERVGDKAWCALLAQHRSLVRDHAAAHGGREINVVGDGFQLAFESPSRAVRFAVSVMAVLKNIEVNIRIGIHTGECEVVDSRLEGVAVHTAARVASVAGAGEILVSSTVRDVLAGSAYEFERRERHVLKGLSEARELFAVQRP